MGGIQKDPLTQRRSTLVWIRRSIAGRMLMLAAVWSLLVLACSGAYLMSFYRAETQRLLDAEIEAAIKTLTHALAEPDEEDRIVVRNELLPNDPRFRRLLSGWYYGYLKLDEEGGVADILPSRSLWDSPAPIRADQVKLAVDQVGAIVTFDAVDATGQSLRVGVRAVLLPDHPLPVGIFAAIDRGSIDESARRLGNRLGIVMGAICLGVLLGALIQVHLGLAPLRRIRESLDAIRGGRDTRLKGDYPFEIQPMVDDLNRVLDHNTEVVERARTHVGNLAHALKNPIAVLMNEPGGDDAYTQLVQRHARAMWGNVDHYLKRAQAAARAEVLGARTDIEPAVEDIGRLLERLHRDKDLAVETDIEEGVVFRGERQDLDDLLGNLMENAAKWCRVRVKVSARRVNGDLEVYVDDDGPGLAPEDREVAMERGRRLDETAPGTGLGLSIVKELAELYGGGLTLESSPLGGLRARLTLPSAAL